MYWVQADIRDWYIAKLWMSQDKAVSSTEEIKPVALAIVEVRMLVWRAVDELVVKQVSF